MAKPYRAISATTHRRFSRISRLVETMSVSTRAADFHDFRTSPAAFAPQ